MRVFKNKTKNDGFGDRAFSSDSNTRFGYNFEKRGGGGESLFIPEMCCALQLYTLLTPVSAQLNIIAPLKRITHV